MRVETDHFGKCKQQRGITDTQKDLILKHGKRFRRPGNVYTYRITKKKRRQLTEKVRRRLKRTEAEAAETAVNGNRLNDYRSKLSGFLQAMEGINNKVLIVSKKDGGVVLTGYTKE